MLEAGKSEIVIKIIKEIIANNKILEFAINIEEINNVFN